MRSAFVFNLFQHIARCSGMGNKMIVDNESFFANIINRNNIGSDLATRNLRERFRKCHRKILDPYSEYF